MVRTLCTKIMVAVVRYVDLLMPKQFEDAEQFKTERQLLNN